MSDRPADWAVEVWNALVPIGTPVELLNDNHEPEKTKTLSKAWVLCNQPVVKVEGRSGGYLLYRLRSKPRMSMDRMVIEALKIRHKQTYAALRALYDTMRAVVVRTGPSIKSQLELSPELFESLEPVLRDTDPYNNVPMQRILKALTAAPAVCIPCSDLDARFPPTDVEELRQALESGQRQVMGPVRVWDGPSSSEVTLDMLAEDQPTPGSKIPAERPLRGWTCAVCGFEVHHAERVCPDCDTEKGCG